VHIDFAAHRSPTSGKLSNANTAPPPLSAPDFGLNRERIPPPRERHEYLPELMPPPNVHAKEARDELRPLHVSQPQGVSFKVKGSKLEWQKWKMHVCELILISVFPLSVLLGVRRISTNDDC
jgi:primary-amine oxidase